MVEAFSGPTIRQICRRDSTRLSQGLLPFGFWAMNVGLMAQIVLSVLPVGLLQTWASVQPGYWYARSAEFLGTGCMQTLRWLRVPGDTLLAIGAIALVVFIIGLHYGWSLEGGTRGGETEAARRAAA